MTHWVPELLSPAGDLQKLELALLYGADAVYLSGHRFGLRTRASNFSREDIITATQMAHKLNKKVYITLNIYAFDDDLSDLPNYLIFLNDIKVDALIICDLGILKIARKYAKDIPIHLSTQASCLNSEAATFYKDVGVNRIILGRECSLYEAALIKNKADMEVELFIHGSLCSSYSGNCIISNYTRGRDSNRGGCAHSCRFNYDLKFKDKKVSNVNFISSKDLNGLSLIEKFIEYKIDSLKIEGRMRSVHYISTVISSYASLLKHYRLSKKIPKKVLVDKLSQLEKVSNRGYYNANLDTKEQDSIYHDRNSKKGYSVGGIVLEANRDNYLLVNVLSSFKKGELLELITFDGESHKFVANNILDVKNSKIKKTRPGTLIKLPWIDNACNNNIIRVVAQ